MVRRTLYIALCALTVLAFSYSCEKPENPVDENTEIEDTPEKEEETPEDKEDMIDELIDRFGEPSKSVTNLVAISMLRKRLTKLGVVKTVQNGESVYIYTDLTHLKPAEALCMFYKNNKLTFRSSSKPYFVLKTDKKNTLADLEIFADGFEEIIRRFEESQK